MINKNRHLVLFLPEGLIAVYPTSIAYRTEFIIKSNESDARFFCLFVKEKTPELLTSV